MPLNVGDRLGHYDVTALIGEGGMGEVYRARDTKLDRDVALKVLPQAFTEDPDRLARFQREAKVLASLNHPNICTVHDIGEVDGRPFIVMEVVQGTTLQQQLTTGPLPPRQVIDLGMQLADALGAAHAEGVIHRDLKPANVVVNDRGHAKLLDFGLAKLNPSVQTGSDDQFGAPTIEAVELTGPRSAIGTVAYMSPEQARGERLDKRTDLFSLGAVLYEMVTGQRAFAGQSTAVVFDGILNRAPVLPADISQSMPARLVEIISNALEKDPELRYQSSADVLADLKRAKRDLDSGQSTVAGTTSVSAAGPVRTGVSSAGTTHVPRGGVDAAVTGSPQQVSGTRWVAVACGGSLLALLMMFFVGPWRAGPERTEINADDRVAALVQSQIALTTDSLARDDYQSAIAHADAALAMVPDEIEALRIHAAAQAALLRVADEPSATSGPLAAAPPQSADASARIVPPSPPSPRRADPDPPGGVPPAQPTPETQTARPEAPVPAAIPDPPASATPAVAPPIAAESVTGLDAVTPRARTETAQPLADTPAERTPDADTRVEDTAPSEAPSDVPTSQDDDAAIREVLATFERAIETKDMTLYRSVRPTLSADEVSRVRAGFEAVESQQVDLRIVSIDVQGDQAVVRLSRRDTIQTGGGEQHRESNQTVRLTKMPEGWVIIQMGG